MLKNIKSKIYIFLRKSEKYTKTDMVYLARGGFWLVGGRIAASASALLLSIAFANLLPPDTYGTYKYILATASLFGITALPGINTALTRAISLGHEHVIGSAIKTKFKWALLGGLSGLVLALYYYLQANTVLAIGFFIAAVLVPVTEGCVVYGAILQGKKQFKQSAILTTLYQSILAIGLIVTVLLTKNLSFILLCYYTLTAGVGVALTYYILQKYTIVTDISTDSETTDIIKYGKQLSWLAILGTVTSKLDTILLWHFLGAAPVAIYAFALAPISQVRALLKTINILSLPKFATQNPQLIRKTLQKKVALFSLILIIPTAGYIIIAPSLFALLFPQYLNAVVYSQILATSLIFFPQGLIAQALAAHKKTTYLYTAQSIEAFSRIILLATLPLFYGIMGAVFAFIIPQAINSIVLRYYLNKL